ncbi:MAG: hypothetical protein RML45_12675 [Acetobacteraceae bacterium]|nr:hypothetical protein [Acetobacteraceae bacterium]
MKPSAAAHALAHLLDGGRVALGALQEVAGLAADEFGERIARHPLEGRVHPLGQPARVGDDHRRRHLAHDESEPGVFAFALRPFGDVLDRAVEGLRPALDVEQAAAAHAHGEPPPARGDEGEVEIPRRAVALRCRDGREEPRARLLRIEGERGLDRGNKPLLHLVQAPGSLRPPDALPPQVEPPRPDARHLEQGFGESAPLHQDRRVVQILHPCRLREAPCSSPRP